MDFRQRLEQSRTNTLVNEPSGEPEDLIVTAYYATERGGTPSCLDLRLSDGNRVALPYSYLNEVRFAPDKGIMLTTSQKEITITGRSLLMLYEALVGYRVRYIQADQGQDSQEDGLFVEEILITAL